MCPRFRCSHFLLALAVVAALRCSWDAPRDNSLDPSLGGNISGRVLTRRATPIAGARVSVPGVGRLIVTAYLNGLPYLQNCKLTTHVYGRGWPPEPLEFCTLTATAGDIDGASDVDSVWVEIPAIGSSERLSYDSDSRVYVQTLRAADLPGEGLDTLVGQEVRFNVADLESTVAACTLSGVSRIIYDLPEPAFPSGGVDTLSSDTLFTWYRFDHGFGVRYHGQIVRIEGGSPAGIAAEFDTPDTALLVNSGLLNSGDYYWTIEAIDGFGNSSRSAEEVFHAR